MTRERQQASKSPPQKKPGKHGYCEGTAFLDSANLLKVPHSAYHDWVRGEKEHINSIHIRHNTRDGKERSMCSHEQTHTQTHV
jgi:hypothetical protein